MVKWGSPETATGEVLPQFVGAALAEDVVDRKDSNWGCPKTRILAPRPKFSQSIQLLKTSFIVPSFQPLLDPTETGNKVGVGFSAWGLGCEWGAGVTCVGEDTPSRV